MLLIGGSRFVGPPLIDVLLQRGHEVSVFNRGILQSAYRKGVRFIKGNRDGGFDMRDRFDAVIDMCAYTGEQTRRALRDLNFDFFVHMSTAAVYKKQEKFPIREDTELGSRPALGDYGEGKIECELALKKSAVAFAVIRPVYILGPQNYVERERFLYAKIKNGDPIVLPGNGQALIQFTFARDVAASLALLAEKEIGGAFNCAGSEVITLKGLVEEMAAIMERSARVEYNAASDGDNFNLAEFPFANLNLYCANDKLTRLGISFTDLSAGLREDYERYYKHAV